MDSTLVGTFLSPDAAALFLAHLGEAHKDVYAGEPTPKHVYATLSLDRINNNTCSLECNLCGKQLAP